MEVATLIRLRTVIGLIALTGLAVTLTTSPGTVLFVLCGGAYVLGMLACFLLSWLARRPK